MPSSYAGNPASYPASIQLPSDGDPKNAASVNAALEGLADRTATILSNPVFEGGTMLINEDVIFGNTSTFTCTGGFFVLGNGAMTCQSDFPVTFEGGVTNANGCTVEFESGSTCQFDVGSNLLIGGTCTTVGTVTCTFYNVHVPNDLTVDGLAAFNGQTDLTAVVATGTHAYSGAGHARYRGDPGADAARIFSIDGSGGYHAADFVHFTGALTADRDWTFKNSGAAAGDMIEISLVGSSGDFFVNVKRDDGTTLVAMSNLVSTALNPIYYVKLRHTGTNWVIFTQSRKP